MTETHKREYLTPLGTSVRPDQREWLEQEARRRGIAQAEIVREALDEKRDRSEVR
jgi:hypothetical protein